MAEPAIDIRDLQVRRGGRDIVHGLDLRIPSGRITGLLGPSGGGKTTLMRAIVGSQRISDGTVSVLGRPAGSRELRRTVGYVTQAASVYDDLTVRQNVSYFARIVGASRTDIDRVINQVDLGEYLAHRVDRLSGGQRNRVSLAVALLGDPQLLILDEPTVGLDPVLRRDLWNIFRALADAGKTLLVSSHVMDEAARCDDLILLRDGAVVAHDTPANLLARTHTSDYAEAFLAIIEGRAA